MFAFIILGFVMLVTTMAYWALSHVASPARRMPLRVGVLLFDALSLLALFGHRWLEWLPLTVQRFGMVVVVAAWMSQLIFGLLVAAVLLLLRLLWRHGGKVATIPWPWRLAVAAMVAASAVGGVGARTVVNRVDVPIAQLPPSLDGFTVAQLSDVHLGLFFTLDDLDALLRRTAELAPDVLVLTGDIFDDEAMNVEAAHLIDRYAAKFPHGICFVYGNHEYFRNVVRTDQALAMTSIRVLRNDGVVLVDDATRPLYLAGVDYPRPRDRFDPLEAEYTRLALAARPHNAVTVLLAHHSDFIQEAAKHGVDLVLTGHTHGGQLGVGGRSIAPPLFRFMRGRYAEPPSTLGYVHTGNGSWFPYRLGCPPEIALFTLSAKHHRP